MKHPFPLGLLAATCLAGCDPAGPKAVPPSDGVPPGARPAGEAENLPVDEGLATTYSIAPAVSWAPAEAAPRYEIEIAADAGFARLVLRDTTPVPRFVAPRGLGPGRYWWRARPVGAAGWSATGQLHALVPGRTIDIPPDADAAAIAAAVREAAAQGPAVVRFPERGRLRLDVPDVLLEVRGARGLVIDGRGCTIVLTNPMSGFAKVFDSTAVSFRDFTVEHDPPPFTVGIVRAADPATREIELEIEPGLPPLDAPHLIEDWSFCMLLENDPPGRILDGSPLVPGLVKGTLRRVPGGFAIRAAESIPAELLKPGLRIVQFARRANARSLAHVERSAEMAFVGMVNHSISGGHYLLLESDGARILDCHSRPAPGRSYGGNADGVHVRSTTVGPWVEGCSFQSIGDDGVALFSKGIEVLGQPDPQTVRLDEKFFSLKEGQEALFFDPRKGEPVGGVMRVLSIAPAPGGGRLVRFDHPLPTALVHGLDRPWKNDQAFNLSARHRHFVVRRNSFRDIRRYGVIARAEQGAIEENVFEGVSDSAVTLMNEPAGWRNGLHSTGILIAGNRMNRCNFTASARGRGVIHVDLRAIEGGADPWASKAAGWQGHSDIAIARNTIADWRGCAIALRNIRGAVVEANRIAGQRPSEPGMPPGCAVRLERVTGASLAGNVFEGLEPGTREVCGPER